MEALFGQVLGMEVDFRATVNLKWLLFILGFQFPEDLAFLEVFSERTNTLA